MRMSSTRAIAERKALNFYEWYDDILENLDKETAQAFLASLFMYAFKGDDYIFENEQVQKDFERAKRQIDDDRESAIKKINRNARKCKGIK